MRQRFPNNEDRRSFRIRRRLSRPSRRSIAYCAELTEIFPNQDIKPIQAETDLTIIGKMDIVDARHRVPRLGEMLFKDLATEIMEPRPVSSRREKLARVISVGYIGTRETVRAALFLEDKKNSLQHEYANYTSRLDALGAAGRWKGMLPHISLALVPQAEANEDILEWISASAPLEIMLLPVDTDPRVPKD